MTEIMSEKVVELNRKELTIDCSECWGICCIHLYFSKSDGFPNNKAAGTPCSHLSTDYSCSIHQQLANRGYNGCLSFDCLGAGQKISQVTFRGDGDEGLQPSDKILEAFQLMRQLHELLWYLLEALDRAEAVRESIKIRELYDKIHALTLLEYQRLILVDISLYRAEVNAILLDVSEGVRGKVKKVMDSSLKTLKGLRPRADFAGQDLRGYDLSGGNFRGSLLIASNLKNCDLNNADFIGVDLRDADISGADFSKSLFITQAQINAAKGSVTTKLPKYIKRPAHWDNNSMKNE